MTDVHHRCVTTLDVGKPSSSGVSWESFKILFHRFAALPSAVGQITYSPKFSCNGHEWRLLIYPGGDSQASAEYVSLFLQLCSGGHATASYELSILDKCQNTIINYNAIDDRFVGAAARGWKEYCKRSDILNTHIDDDGTLAIVVAMKKDAASPPPFLPSNPMSGMITGIFLDEETADVCFEVRGAEDNRDDAAPLPVTFHAHSFILKICAPMLASLFDSDDEKIETVSIIDVKPVIFRHLLHYVYGGSLPDREMKIYSKDIVNAADKYAIVNLKLEAEAAYVKSTKIKLDNAMDNLLFADAVNLALLKEVVMDYLVENYDEAIRSLSFADAPGYLMKDLMVAFGRKMKSNGCATEGSKEDLSTMRVSELRWKLSELGLDVDGSREAMIEALKNVDGDRPKLVNQAN